MFQWLDTMMMLTMHYFDSVAVAVIAVKRMMDDVLVNRYFDSDWAIPFSNV